MAATITKLLPGAKVGLVPADDSPANGVITTTTLHTLAASDTAVHEDEIRVDVSYSGGTLGESANFYLAQSNFAGTEIDGNAPVNNVGTTDILPNLGVPISVISQAAAASRGSGVMRCTKAAFVIVTENSNTAEITSLVIEITPLSYSSE